MNNPRRISPLIPAVALWLAAAVSAQLVSADGRWVHISIEQDDDSSIEINLPLEAVEHAVNGVPQKHRHHHWLVLHSHHFHARDFHRMVEAARRLDREEERSFRVRGRRYLLSRSTDDLLIEREGRLWQEEVTLRLSFAVAEALTSGDRDEIDWPAGLRALAETGTREDIVLSDDDGETTMRLWVDARSSS